jgi:hypothetical protein
MGRRVVAITATGVKTPDYWESAVRQGYCDASGTNHASDRSTARSQASQLTKRRAPQMTRQWTHTKALDRSRQHAKDQSRAKDGARIGARVESSVR